MLSKLWKGCYSGAGSNIRDKVKFLLDFVKLCYQNTTGFCKSDLAAKKYFIGLKAVVDKLDINELVKVLTGLSNLKTNLNDFDVDRLKTIPMDLKKVSDVVCK